MQHAAPVVSIEQRAQVTHRAKVQARALRLGGLVQQLLAALLQQQRTQLTVCFYSTNC